MRVLAETIIGQVMYLVCHCQIPICIIAILTLGYGHYNRFSKQ